MGASGEKGQRAHQCCLCLRVLDARLYSDPDLKTWPWERNRTESTGRSRLDLIARLLLSLADRRRSRCGPWSNTKSLEEGRI